MKRREYIGAVATGGICVAGLGLAYQLDQSNISLGVSADLSETVSGNTESFEFDVVAGEDIYITITDTQDAPYQGRFALYDPGGNEVLDGVLSTSETRTDVHTADQEGTYRIAVNPEATSVNVNVHVRDPSE